MKPELLIAVAAATIVAGVAGCSSSNKASGPSSSSATSSAATSSNSATSPSNTPAAARGEPKVTIGGQPQNVSGPVMCSMTDGQFSEGAPGNNASATKNGNTYHITGTASGVDNAGQQVNR